MSEQFRVSYVNKIDGKRRVLIGAVDRETAKRVREKFGNPRDDLNYMGPGVRIDAEDGTPDGAVIGGST